MTNIWVKARESSFFFVTNLTKIGKLQQTAREQHENYGATPAINGDNTGVYLASDWSWWYFDVCLFSEALATNR